MSRRLHCLLAFAIVLASLAARSVAAQPGATPTPPGVYDPMLSMPEVLVKVAPVYPDIAWEAAIEGTVIVSALVGRDGLVQDTRITQSNPMLDAAAVASVKRWRFKPALANGGAPMAVWVAIPVKFALATTPRDGAAPALPPRYVPFPGLDESYPPDLGRSRGPDEPASLHRFTGPYHVASDTSSHVLVTSVGGDRVELESPGDWTGAGVLRGNTYWGVFVYGDDTPVVKNRGARGTHLGSFGPDGHMRVVGTFTNRPWPPFHITWSPSGVRTVSAREVERERADVLTPRSPGGNAHPVWPPEGREQPEQKYEHPVWPPQWYQGDDRIVLAEGMSADTPPQVSRRVEPIVPEGAMRGEGDDLVVVRALVLRDGSVTEAHVTQSRPPLDEPALAAVRQWRFRPALWHGRPIAVWVYLPVRFR